jgi:hypothetical protein
MRHTSDTYFHGNNSAFIFGLVEQNWIRAYKTKKLPAIPLRDVYLIVTTVAFQCSDCRLGVLFRIRSINTSALSGIRRSALYTSKLSSVHKANQINKSKLVKMKYVSSVFTGLQSNLEQYPKFRPILPVIPKYMKRLHSVMTIENFCLRPNLCLHY